MDRSLADRAAVHAALGDPTRLAIVDDLTCSDRSPGELADRFELRGNLLAHHLDVLERAGVIERFRSAGDQRRRYVRLVVGLVVDLGVSAPRTVRDVTFVCTHNSARSQLAAALWKQHTGIDARSAGTEPAERVHPGAVAAARRHGLDLSDARPQPFDRTKNDSTIVTVCDLAHEKLDPSPDDWHWSIPDPVAIGTAAAFDDAIDQLGAHIRNVN